MPGRPPACLRRYQAMEEREDKGSYQDQLHSIGELLFHLLMVEKKIPQVDQFTQVVYIPPPPKNSLV